MRVHAAAEIGACSNRRWPAFAFASALATAVEHQIQRRELSRATGRRGVVFGRRSQSDAGVGRSLYDERQNFARRRGRSRSGGFWRPKCALHLGENVRRSVDLSNVLSFAPLYQFFFIAGLTLLLSRRSFLSHFRL